jgi:hypothetical protein
VVYSKTCAVTGRSLTMFVMAPAHKPNAVGSNQVNSPSWYTPKAAKQSKTRGLTALRPSATIHMTTCHISLGRSELLTFCQPSLPHTLEFLRPHKCAMFFITPYKVRQNSSASSLYIVMTTNSSVCRGGSHRFCRSRSPDVGNSSGSVVTAV